MLVAAFTKPNLEPKTLGLEARSESLISVATAPSIYLQKNLSSRPRLNVELITLVLVCENQGWKALTTVRYHSTVWRLSFVPLWTDFIFFCGRRAPAAFISKASSGRLKAATCIISRWSFREPETICTIDLTEGKRKAKMLQVNLIPSGAEAAMLTKQSECNISGRV